MTYVDVRYLAAVAEFVSVKLYPVVTVEEEYRFQPLVTWNTALDKFEHPLNALASTQETFEPIVTFVSIVQFSNVF